MSEKRDWIIIGSPGQRVRDIVFAVARESGIDISDIYGPSRARRFAWPRHAAMYLIRERLGKSTTQIGRIFDRDHTTVIDALNAVRAAPHRYPLIEVNE